MPKHARLQRTTRYVALSRGVKKRLMAGGPVTIDGVGYTPQELLAELKELVDANDDTVQAHAAWRAQVLKQRALEKAKHSFLDGLGVVVLLQYGKDPKALGDFGLDVPKKPGPKTAAVKAAAAVKGRATRVERGTAGKRSRKKAKGG